MDGVEEAEVNSTLVAVSAVGSIEIGTNQELGAIMRLG